MKLINPPVAASALLLVSISLPLAAIAAGADRRQLNVHEHGVTTLNIALEQRVRCSS